MMSKNTSFPISAVFMDKPEECMPEMDVCNFVFSLRECICLFCWSLKFYYKSLNLVVTNLGFRLKFKIEPQVMVAFRQLT